MINISNVLLRGCQGATHLSPEGTSIHFVQKTKKQSSALQTVGYDQSGRGNYCN